MIQVIKPVQNLNDVDLTKTKTSVFLAGSIEMGTAKEWQNEVIDLINKSSKSITIFNPRRDNWDSSWTQSINNSMFKEQVLWELDALDKADWILMYLDPHTKAPISLLEFGRYADTNKLLVVCPEGFWRKGNVDIVCERENIPQFDTLEDAVNKLLNF